MNKTDYAKATINDALRTITDYDTDRAILLRAVIDWSEQSSWGVPKIEGDRDEIKLTWPVCIEVLVSFGDADDDGNWLAPVNVQVYEPSANGTVFYGAGGVTFHGVPAPQVLLGLLKGIEAAYHVK